MKRVEDTIKSAGRKKPDAREVPLMVPHGSGHAGRDFESAFELLQNDQQTRASWHRERVKVPFAPAS